MKMNVDRVPFVDLIRLHEPIHGELDEVWRKVSRKGNFILGEDVEVFEENFARYCGVKYAVGVNSGTSALELSLRALGIGKEDEVIIPTNTFNATAAAVASVEAIPVFVDIGKDYNLNTNQLEDLINENTKAIIPVHLYGQLCDIQHVLDVAKKYGLRVVEDACQAHGAYHNAIGKKAGAIGDIGCFSFYPSKNLGAFGDAGIVVSDNDEIMQKIRDYRNYGQREKNIHSSLGHNSRLDNLQAAVLNAKLPHLNEWNQSRINSSCKLNKGLAEFNGLVVPIPCGCDHVFHLYVVRSNRRDELKDYLNKKKIGTGIHYPSPLHLQLAFSHLGYKEGDFPNAEKYSKEILSLPMFPYMKDEEIDYIVDSVAKFIEKY